MKFIKNTYWYKRHESRKTKPKCQLGELYDSVHESTQTKPVSQLSVLYNCNNDNKSVDLDFELIESSYNSDNEIINTSDTDTPYVSLDSLNAYDVINKQRS